MLIILAYTNECSDALVWVVTYRISRKYDGELNLAVSEFLRKPPNLIHQKGLYLNLACDYSISIAAALLTI